MNDDGNLGNLMVASFDQETDGCPGRETVLLDDYWEVTTVERAFAGERFGKQTRVGETFQAAPSASS
jgi:hypothetical protein